MNKYILHDRFASDRVFKQFKWFNPPEKWEIDPKSNALIVQAKRETDFWQKTHYGFSADNGHFLYSELRGDFTLSTQVKYCFRHRYDQAGLMIRISPERWIKTAIEYEPNTYNKLGVVVTNLGHSDWSTQNVPKEISEITFRIKRKGFDYIIEYRTKDLDNWALLRMVHFGKEKVKGGLYACSPKGRGFLAQFSRLRIEKRTI